MLGWLCWFALLSAALAARSTISNVAIRYDVDGRIVDCHSGNIVKMGDTYFMYGEYYGNNHQAVSTNTDRPRLSVYTSKDMQAWTFGGLLHNNTKGNNTWANSGLWPGAAKDMGTWWCPVGVYNQARKKIILWWTATPGSCCDAFWGVAESDDGIHFELITMNETGATAFHEPSAAPYLRSQEGRRTAMLSSRAWARRRLLPGASSHSLGIANSKDGNAVMVDDDGTGYIATTIINPDNANASSKRSHVVAIELLSPDLRHAAGFQVGPTFPDEFVEGVMLFKRQGRYYVIYSSCCCACRAGAGVVVYSATNISGPWSPQQRDVNCKPFPPSSTPPNNTSTPPCNSSNHTTALAMAPPPPRSASHSVPTLCVGNLLDDTGTVCCPKACGACGGTGCEGWPGGRAACCTGGVESGGKICKAPSDSACVMPPPPPVIPNGTFICAGMAAPLVDRRPTGRLIIPAQGFSVSALPGTHSLSLQPNGSAMVAPAEETTFMWLGQRWLSGPGNPPRCTTLCTAPTGDCAAPAYSNSNDFSYWIPLEFDADGQVHQFEPFVREWSLDLR